MPKERSKNSSVLVLIMLLVVVLLTTVSSYLYSQNREYEKENRNLIIKNDSIISVNIELNAVLKDQFYPAATDRKTSFTKKGKTK